MGKCESGRSLGNLSPMKQTIWLTGAAGIMQKGIALNYVLESLTIVDALLLIV